MNGFHKEAANEHGQDQLASYNGWPNNAGFIGDSDCLNPVELTVTGRIPYYAAGILYRNGPGGYKVESTKGNTVAMSHWFDGFSQVHRFQILPSTSDGPITKVLYNSRTTVDKLIEDIRESGSFKTFSFGQKQDPCQSLFRKVMSMFASSPQPHKADANIGVTISVNPPGFSALDSVPIREKDGHTSEIRTVFAKTDGATVKQLDPETLEPLGIVNQTSLNPELKGQLAAAHAKTDPLTGEVFNYNLALGSTAVYKIFRAAGSTGKTDVLATIKDAPAAYLHSLFLTKNYVILCVWGSHYAWGGVKILYEKNILDSILPLDSSKPAKWYVVDRNGKGVVAVYDSEPFFAFHTINAWEEPSESNSDQVDIVADICAYENLDVLKRFYYENMLCTSPDALDYVGAKGDSSRATTSRWRLPAINAPGQPKPPSAREAHLEWSMPKSSSCELPTINPKYLTRPHRFVYGVTDRSKSTFIDGIVKIDTKTREALRWQEHGQNPGEAIFVPNPDGTVEDDGVLLSVVLDGVKGNSYLLCLDAKTMKEVGRASLQGVIGYGFHGTHVRAKGEKWPLDC